MEISTIIFEFLSFCKGDIGLPPFVVLFVGAFFIVKAVLARVYASSAEAVPRSQRSAEEEASLNAAKEAVRRKIASKKHDSSEGYEPVNNYEDRLAQDLIQTVAALPRPLTRASKLPLSPKEGDSKKQNIAPTAPQPVLPLSQKLPSLTRAQKAFLSSLVFSKPKALT